MDEVELTVKDIEPGHTTPFHAHTIASEGPGALRLVCLDCFAESAT